jgi:hypothetical protein
LPDASAAGARSGHRAKVACHGTRDRIGRPGTARSILALEKRELGKLCRTAH